MLFVPMLIAVVAGVVGSVWAFRAWGPLAGIGTFVVLGGLTWFVPLGWIAGLVGGLVLIPIAQKTLFRKVAERQSSFSLPPGVPAPGAGPEAPAAQGAGGSVPLPPGSVRCGRCGNPTPSAEAAFDDDGRKLCPACDATNQIDTGDRKALAGVRGGA